MAAFHHHKVTTDTTDSTQGGSRTFGDENEYNASRQTGAVGSDQGYGASDSTGVSNDQSYNSARDSSAVGSSNFGTAGITDDSTGPPNPDDPRLGTFEPEAHPLYSEYPPRKEIPQDQGPLASTPGPFQVPTTDNLEGTSAPPTSSVSSQNAPGKAGEFGEKVMGALGVGGTHVERPKEEQGIGEKIVNFLGA